MKKIVMFLFFLSITSVSFAHPPSNVKISYSSEQSMLAVNFTHLTNNGKKHYIRKISIIRSDVSTEDTYYVRQEEVKDVFKTIPIKLNPKEMIKLKSFLRQFRRN